MHVKQMEDKYLGLFVIVCFVHPVHSLWKIAYSSLEPIMNELIINFTSYTF